MDNTSFNINQLKKERIKNYFNTYIAPDIMSNDAPNSRKLFIHYKEAKKFGVDFNALKDFIREQGFIVFDTNLDTAEIRWD